MPQRRFPPPWSVEELAAMSDTRPMTPEQAATLKQLAKVAYELDALSLGFRLLEPIAALTTIAVNLPAHRALTDAQNFGDAFLARPTLAQCINLAAILILYSPVLAHRQPLAISRGYPIIASLNYALAT
jgi:hypothetical protein